MELRVEEPLGRREGGFAETARWSVHEDGTRVGEIWKAERGGTVCWMQSPDCLGVSIPQSRVSEGYAKTTKKGAAEDVLRWHGLRGERLEVDGWVLHCESAGERERSYRALSPAGTWHPVRAALADGWSARGSRGFRKVAVEGAPTLGAALSGLLPLVARPPEGDEAKPGMVATLAAETVRAAAGHPA